jgi:hypothetical protein
LVEGQRAGVAGLSALSLVCVDDDAQGETADALRGEAEANSLLRLLEDQRSRIAKAEAEPEGQQLRLFPDAEAEQRRRDRRHWREKPDRIARESYPVRADRIEPVGLFYL